MPRSVKQINLFLFNRLNKSTMSEGIKYRLEKDTMGTVEVEASRYWGAQTERSRRNFNIGGERMPIPLIYAFAHLKSVAAQVNGDLGLLNSDACDSSITE
jgi:fumarate hydratase class II